MRNSGGTLIESGKRTGTMPVMTPEQLSADIARAQVVNGIVLDAQRNPNAYVNAFEIKGGGE